MNNKKKNTVYTSFNLVKSNPPKEHQRSDYLKYRKDWEYYSSHFDELRDFPMHLDIEPTSNCNLKCPMCARTQLIEAGKCWTNDNMSMETYKRIIDEGLSNGLYAVNLSMFGESMMNQDLIAMIKYAKAKGVLDVFFNTNATLLSEKMSHELIDSGLDKITISFDSIIKEHYEKIRVNASFDKVVNNIKRLMEIKKERNSQLPIVRIFMTVMDSTKDEKELFHDYWKDIVDEVALNDYMNFIGIDKVDRHNIDLKPRHTKFICHMFWQRLSVTADGSILPCCTDFDKTMTLGNIKDMSLKEAWNSPKLNKFRELHKLGRAIEIQGCNRCDWIHYEC